MIAERNRTEAGFTLVEVLIVVVVIGFVITALAGAFVVVVRASPSNEARADDSRALLNLTTWLSRDVSSAAEDGFTVGVDASGCTGVPSSRGLLELRWSEGSTSYVTNYRYVPTGANTGTIHRYSCRAGQAAEDLKLTPDLNNVTTGTLMPAPVAITLVPTTMTDGSPGHKGLQFVVTVLDDDGVQRELLSLDATTTNVVTTLPPIGGGPGSTNAAPVAPEGATSVVVGSYVDYLIPASDPNGDALTITYSELPLGWTVEPTTGLEARITPDPAATPGAYTFRYTVTDPGLLPGTNLVRVQVIQPDPLNQAPSAQPVTSTATRGVPLTVTLPATDPENGTNLSVSLSGVPAGWTTSISGLDVTITPAAGATNSTVIEYTVTDAGGLTATSTITIHVCTVAIQSVADNPVSVFTNGNNAGELKKSVTVTITTNGACSALVLGFKPKAADTFETVLEFGTATSRTIAANAYIWDIADRDVPLNIRQGANGPVEVSRVLEVNA